MIPLFGSTRASCQYGESEQSIRRPKLIIGLPAGVSAKWWDSHTTEVWSSLVDGTDAIINLAGENISSGRWANERKSGILESRLNAGRAIVQASEKVALRAYFPRLNLHCGCEKLYEVKKCVVGCPSPHLVISP